MRGRHKRWAAPFLEGHPEIVLTSFEATDPFWKAPLALEVGAGKGDFAIAYATANPEVHLLALERDVSICASFAKKAVAAGLKNIRIAPADFDVVSEELEPFSFTKIFLNFSDPWPKKKHWKRRLTTSDRLLTFSALLTDEGKIYQKTDNDGLYLFSKEEAIKAGLPIASDEEDYKFDASSDYMSEYERRFRLLGKKIHRLVYSKKKE